MDIGNGWWRVWFTYPASSINSTIKIYPAWGSNPSFESTVAGDISVFNVQLELAQYPTSPIRTNHTHETRAAEYHQNTTQAGLITPNSGTLLLDYHPLGVSNESFPLLSICSGTQPVIEIARAGSGVPNVKLYDDAGGSDVTAGVVAENTEFNRVVASIGASNLNLAMRDQSTVVGPRTRTPLTPNIMYLGKDCSNTANNPVGVRRMGYWNVVFHPYILQQMANDPL